MRTPGLQHSAFIARSVGIVAIASGFVMGMYGLDYPDSAWLPTSLGLIATGMLAQGYALYFPFAGYGIRIVRLGNNFCLVRWL